MQLKLEALPENKGAIITIDSENLDAGNVREFKEQIAPILNGNDVVLLDMSQLTFVDSSGLGALLSCLRTMNNKNGQLKLFAMAKPVQALFELVRMHRIFSIYNTRDEAVAVL
ncbi:MAG: STAS domain-containing protein [Rhodocyclaceae bacterium]|nr:STAS domain-containing protein [Rhodocyclaceae bacterium]MDZ4216507.1 STAS domain-containing protein [Rhodocyclaceae bacterium]